MDLAGVLNELFAGDAGSRRRGLRLRTYAVIALNDDCGLLQWVEGLLPLKAAIEETYLAEKLVDRRCASRLACCAWVSVARVLAAQWRPGRGAAMRVWCGWSRGRVRARSALAEFQAR